MTTPQRFWARHFIALEFLVAVLLSIAVIAWIQWLGGASVVDSTLAGNRSAVYGALASIFGSLLGFVITAASIILGLSGSDHLRVVRESRHYATLWRVYVCAIRSLSLATVASIVALVIDRDNAIAHWVMYLVVFSTLLAVLRIARSVWVLENIIALVSKPPLGTSSTKHC